MLQSLATNYNYIAAPLVGNEITSYISGKKCFILVRNLQTMIYTRTIYTYVQGALQTKGTDMTKLVTVETTFYMCL
jgi:hypothetical protein